MDNKMKKNYQDNAKINFKEDYELKYEAKKLWISIVFLKKLLRKIGSGRKNIEKK